MTYGFGPALAAQERAPQPLPPCRWRFPDVSGGEADGPIAGGADFAPETVIEAYRAGCFPWPHPQQERLWFSPDPRAIVPIGGLHVARRLARALRQGRFQVTMDGAFEAVMQACADRADEGTWITPRLIAGYVALHDLGWAHSFEVWDSGALAGGLYGVRVGALFGAESMFHRASDASKVAMVAMMDWAQCTGIELIDIQVLTPHTERLGGIEIARTEYLRRARAAMARA